MIAGKGYWIWKIWTTEGGRTQKIAEMAKEANFTHVLFKITDGTARYNVIDDVDYAKNLVNDLHKLGIQAWGWGYTYGYNPRNEAILATNRCKELGVDGFVIDAESEYKQQGGTLKALQYMDRLALGIPVALSSYRFPSVHPQFPFEAFMRSCDFAMPQVYWEQMHNPERQLKMCLSEYAQYNKPVVPAGSAYKRGEWESTPKDVVEFLDASKNEQLSGANFWVWQHTRQYLPETWEAIVNYQWSGEIPEPPDPPTNGGIDVNSIEKLDEVIEHLDAKGKPYTINVNYEINELMIVVPDLPDDGNGDNGNGETPPPADKPFVVNPNEDVDKKYTTEMTISDPDGAAKLYLKVTRDGKDYAEVYKFGGKTYEVKNGTKVTTWDKNFVVDGGGTLRKWWGVMSPNGDLLYFDREVLKK